jgi:hypothetical protein
MGCFPHVDSWGNKCSLHHASGFETVVRFSSFHSLCAIVNASTVITGVPGRSQSWL